MNSFESALDWGARVGIFIFKLSMVCFWIINPVAIFFIHKALAGGGWIDGMTSFITGESIFWVPLINVLVSWSHT